MVVTAALVIGGMPAGLRANVIQGAGNTWVGVEAENYDALSGQRWTVVTTTGTLVTAYGSTALPSDSPASGGAALLDLTGTVGYASYDLTFNTAGTYYVYLRCSVFENNSLTTSYGNEDSIHLSTNWNETVGTSNGETYDFSTSSFGTPSSGNGEGHTYVWDKVLVRNASGTFRSVVLTIPVTAGDLGTPLTFTLRTRENGASVDYVMFSTQSSLTSEQLDTLAGIPEPSAVALAGVALAIALIRRRR